MSETSGTDSNDISRPPDPPPSRPTATLAGTLAGLVALGTGELLSMFSARTPSPVLGVADLLVDETPGGIVRWSIETFGAGQKTILVAGIVVAVMAAGAIAGLVARRNLWRGAAIFAVFGLAGIASVSRVTDASIAWAVVSGVLAAAAGIVALHLLLRSAARSAARVERHRADRAAGRASPPSATGMTRAGDLLYERRGFLVASGLATTWAVIGAGLGRFARLGRQVEESRTLVAEQLGLSPAPTNPPVPAGVATFDGEVPGLTPMITPNRDFYRIDTAILVPQVDPDNWRLTISGLVEREVELTFDELLELPRIEEFVTIACVSNEVGGDLVGNALWSGVPLATLLDLAGVDPAADQIVGVSVDGWTGGFPTAIALDGRPSMVAVTMNGEPLPVKHGFPARLIVPGLYGYVSATKWLTRIRLTTFDDFDGYWIPRGWAKDGPIKTQSRIDVPKAADPIPPGRTPIAGVAWAPTRRISKVEVRIDDGPWQEAMLSDDLSTNTWVQWKVMWDATPGEHQLAVRATDGTGETQIEEWSMPAPSGATGYHTIRVLVT